MGSSWVQTKHQAASITYTCIGLVKQPHGKDFREVSKAGLLNSATAAATHAAPWVEGKFKHVGGLFRGFAEERTECWERSQWN